MQYMDYPSQCSVKTLRTVTAISMQLKAAHKQLMQLLKQTNRCSHWAYTCPKTPLLDSTGALEVTMHLCLEAVILGSILRDAFLRFIPVFWVGCLAPGNLDCFTPAKTIRQPNIKFNQLKFSNLNNMKRKMLEFCSTATQQPKERKICVFLKFFLILQSCWEMKTILRGCPLWAV